jgi:quinoprotein glucose dehydrogenase
MAGGDAERGEQIFYEKIAVSCVRCHKIDDRGGDVGPNLSKIGKDKTRQYLLEAIVDPNRAVAQGFETVVIETNDGQVLSGIIKKETPDEITLVDANAKVFTVKTSDIDSRQKGQSSMPEDVSKLLTPFEVRDLVEFLSGRK